MLFRMAGLMANVRRSAGTGVFTDCVDIRSTGNQINGGGYGGYTIISKIQPAALAAAGSVCRLTMQGPVTGSSVIDACWIGQGATSGNAYNFDGGQVQVRFTGANNVTLASGTTVVSDDVTFAINLSRAIIVSFSTPSSPSSTLLLKRSLTSNFVTYYALGAEAGTTSKSAGYTVESNSAYIPFRIEVA